MFGEGWAWFDKAVYSDICTIFLERAHGIPKVTTHFPYITLFHGGFTLGM